MVTETDEVAAALDRVRAADPNGAISLPELVILGAECKVEQLERQHLDNAVRAQLREQFLERTRTGEGVDWDALTGVREHGWSHAEHG
jgi:hypothetical protein